MDAQGYTSVTMHIGDVRFSGHVRRYELPIDFQHSACWHNAGEQSSPPQTPRPWQWNSL